MSDRPAAGNDNPRWRLTQGNSTWLGTGTAALVERLNRCLTQPQYGTPEYTYILERRRSAT